MDEHFKLSQTEPWLVRFAAWAHDTSSDRPLDFGGVEVPIKVQELLRGAFHTQADREQRFQRIGETAAYVVFVGLALFVCLLLVAAGFWLIGAVR